MLGPVMNSMLLGRIQQGVIGYMKGSSQYLPPPPGGGHWLDLEDLPSSLNLRAGRQPEVVVPVPPGNSSTSISEIASAVYLINCA